MAERSSLVVVVVVMAVVIVVVVAKTWESTVELSAQMIWRGNFPTKKGRAIVGKNERG